MRYMVTKHNMNKLYDTHIKNFNILKKLLKKNRLFLSVLSWKNCESFCLKNLVVLFMDKHDYTIDGLGYWLYVNSKNLKNIKMY
jgi:hypothetical protein